MAIQEHEPVSDQPLLMSEEKRNWWAGVWTKRKLKQSRVAVLHFVMQSTPRPTNPNESIGFGYMSLNKFHDREPELLLSAIESIDRGFFDSFPRKEKTVLDTAFKKAAIGEAAKAFYRHGLSAYGKPGLRGPKDDQEEAGPLAAL